MNKISERCIDCGTTKPASLPFAQIVLNAPFARFSKKQPWFPSSPGNDRHFRELGVCVLGSVTSTESVHYSNDLAAFLKSTAYKCEVDEMSYQRIRGCEYMSPWYHNSEEFATDSFEECSNMRVLFRGEYGKSRDRLSYDSIMILGQPPYASVATASFCKVLRGIFN